MFLIYFYPQGKSEFIGRALARPHIKLRDDPYGRPHLEWHDLFRGTDHAGELLATFELLQVCAGGGGGGGDGGGPGGGGGGPGCGGSGVAL